MTKKNAKAKDGGLMIQPVETSGDWKLIERTLRAYGRVTLQCDNDNVELLVAPSRRNWLQLVIVVLVNGKIDLDGPVKRYCMPKSRFVFTEKSREQAKKLSKQRLKRLGVDPSAKVTFHDPRWSSFLSMKQHFVKTCEKITWERQDAAQ